MLKPADRTMEGTMDDLMDFFPQGPTINPKNLAMQVNKVLSDNGHGNVQIPAADQPTQSVYFLHRELFNRFALLPIVDQTSLLAAIRKAMEKHETKRIRLKIKWSKHGMEHKFLSICMSDNGELVFNLLNLN